MTDSNNTRDGRKELGLFCSYKVLTLQVKITVVPSYPWGIYSKTPSGCLKPNNSKPNISSMFFQSY